MKISLVIPAYNEAAIIKDTVNSALDKLSGSFDSFELIVVDDGSTDGTKNILGSLPHGSISVLGGGVNRGKGYAIRTGMLAATGDIVFFTDADLAYGLEIIKSGVKLLAETGADIVVGSRKIGGGGYGEYPLLRLFASKCFSQVLQTASGMRYDTQCGFKGFLKHAADDIFKNCAADGYSFDFEAMMLAALRGYRIVELPVRIINHRDSHVNVLRDGVKMLGEIAEIKRGIRKTMEYTAQ